MIYRFAIGDFPTSHDAHGTEQVLVELYLGAFYPDPDPWHSFSLEISDTVFLGAVTIPLPEPNHMSFSAPGPCQQMYDVHHHNILVTLDLVQGSMGVLQVHDFER
jgi:hypothetical protein